MKEPCRILLLTGIREELHCFLKEHAHEFDRASRVYRFHDFPGLCARTSGAGLKKRKELKKTIRILKPGLILNAGLVGKLTTHNGPQIGECIDLSCVVDLRGSVLLKLSGHGGALVSVEQLVLDKAARMDLFQDSGAEFCDMESGPLLHLLKEIGFTGSIHFVKMVGDTPADSRLYEHEFKTRQQKECMTLKYGMMNLWYCMRLRFRKRSLYGNLSKIMAARVKDILTGNLHWNDNIHGELN